MVNTGRLRQFHAAFACGFGSCLCGILTTWPSYTSEVYRSNVTTPLAAPMTKMEESLLGSLPSLGAMVGIAIAGSILDMFGRRNGGVLLSLPYSITWTIIGLSSSINLILATRFFSGISGGGVIIMLPLLMSEVSEDSIRGSLVSVSMFMYCLGMFLSYAMGWCLQYRTIIFINIGFSLASTITIALLVESPVHLLRKRRFEEAKVSIAKYRGEPVSSTKVMDELHILKQRLCPATEYFIKKADEVENQKLNPQDIPCKEDHFISSYKTLFWSQPSRRAFMLMITVTTLQVFMGMTAVQVYASTVFTESDSSRSGLHTVVFAVVQFVGSFVSALTADKFGRRILQIGSASLVGICLASLGYLLQNRIAPPWVTVVLTMIFCFFFFVGPGSVPFVLLSEVFLPEVLSLASMCLMEWICLMNFFAIAIFPYITHYFGMHGAFYGCAVISFVNATISYVIMPETAGKSNEEIQKLFVPRRQA